MAKRQNSRPRQQPLDSLLISQELLTMFLKISRASRVGAVELGRYRITIITLLLLCSIYALVAPASANEQKEYMNERPGVAPFPGTLLTSGANAHGTNLGTRDTLFAIEGLDQRSSIAVGALGIVITSTSQGAIKKIPLATDTNLFSVINTGDNEIWIGGEHGQLFVTDTTLTQWQPVSLNSEGNIFKIIKRVDNSLIAVGSYGLLMASNKARRKWHKVDIDWSLLLKEAWDEFGESFPHLYSGCVSPGGEIIVVGEYGLVLQETSNQWEKKHGGAIESAIFDCVAPDDGGTVIAVGQKGLVLRSVDSGETWIESFTGLDSDLYRIEYFDQVFLALGDGKKLYLSNEGTEWQCVQFMSDTSLGWYVDAAVKDSDIELIGNRGSLMKTTRAGILGALKNLASSAEFVACE